MPLDPNKLGQDLAQRWLGEGSGMPSSATDSGQRFASVVAEWFAQATSNGLPCASALPRQPQLAGLATVALSSGGAQTAGAQLGLALTAYLTGQLFGTFAAVAPVGTPIAISALIATFSLTDESSRAQADRIAQACMALVLTTLVPMPPAPTPFPII